jgi:hypothetical protein
MGILVNRPKALCRKALFLAQGRLPRKGYMHCNQVKSRAFRLLFLSGALTYDGHLSRIPCLRKYLVAVRAIIFGSAAISVQLKLDRHHRCHCFTFVSS